MLVLAGCSSSGQAERSSRGTPTPSSAPSPSPAASTASPSAGGASIPDGVYVTTITRADTDRSADAHIVNLGTGLIGRYRMTARDGVFSVSLDGRTDVPTPSPRRTGGEGAYARYGFWVFLGVPPIGEGTYTGSSSRVVFTSERGACFQAGASEALTTGTYAWKLHGNELFLSSQAPGTGATTDGCLGRRFVFTAHPWQTEA